MREYSSAEVVELTARFKQKTRERVTAWLLCLWDRGTNSIMLNRLEMSKLDLVTAQPALRQRLYAAGMGGN